MKKREKKNTTKQQSAQWLTPRALDFDYFSLSLILLLVYIFSELRALFFIIDSIGRAPILRLILILDVSFLFGHRLRRVHAVRVRRYYARLYGGLLVSLSLTVDESNGMSCLLSKERERERAILTTFTCVVWFRSHRFDGMPHFK